MGFAAVLSFGWTTLADDWRVEKHNGYTLWYTSADQHDRAVYRKSIERGIRAVKQFFGTPYRQPFDVYVHPNRGSLDAAWQKDWNMPDFQSECWMVASGVAAKLDLLAPRRWDKESCEHHYAETTQTQQLITHELVHVYHGQLNASPDFSQVSGIDWFVEGLATYASGQCDSVRIAAVKQALNTGKIPRNLDGFWTGNLKYGLSGSMVMYLHHRYGNVKLQALLPLTQKSTLLSALETTEPALLEAWKQYLEQL